MQPQVPQPQTPKSPAVPHLARNYLPREEVFSTRPAELRSVFRPSALFQCIFSSDTLFQEECVVAQLQLGPLYLPSTQGLCIRLFRPREFPLLRRGDAMGVCLYGHAPSS